MTTGWLNSQLSCFYSHIHCNDKNYWYRNDWTLHDVTSTSWQGKKWYWLRESKKKKGRVEQERDVGVSMSRERERRKMLHFIYPSSSLMDIWLYRLSFFYSPHKRVSPWELLRRDVHHIVIAETVILQTRVYSRVTSTFWRFLDPPDSKSYEWYASLWDWKIAWAQVEFTGPQPTASPPPNCPYLPQRAGATASIEMMRLVVPRVSRDVSTVEGDRIMRNVSHILHLKAFIQSLRIPPLSSSYPSGHPSPIDWQARRQTVKIHQRICKRRDDTHLPHRYWARGEDSQVMLTRQPGVMCQFLWDQTQRDQEDVNPGCFTTHGAMCGTQRCR